MNKPEQMTCTGALLAISLSIAVCVPLSDPSHFDSVPSVSYVFKHTEELGYMHMSTIERIGSSSTIVVAFQTAKKHEGDNDQRIVVKTSDNLGQTWNAHTTAVDGPLAVWGPVLEYVDSKLWMFYSASGAPEARPARGNASYPGGDIKVTVSSDEGKTWGAPRTLLTFEDRRNISKVTANKLAITTNGTWLLPFWQEGHTTADVGPSCAGVLRSTDRGLTWSAAGCLQSKEAGWLIENSLAQLEDGRLLMVFRTKCGKMFRSYSSDEGLTWSTATATKLDNPNAKICLFRRTDGPGVVLAYNPTKKGRTPLALATTTDGLTWTPFATLETDKHNSFDYPTPIQVGSNVYTTYSADDHTAIKMAVVPLPAAAKI